jgi:IS30 family transposase
MLSDFGTEVPGELCMSNHLSMANIQSIETLHRAGHSNREIARIWGIDRGAVNKYVQRLRAAEAPPSLPDAATADSQNRPNLHMPPTGH